MPPSACIQAGRRPGARRAPPPEHHPRPSHCPGPLAGAWRSRLADSVVPPPGLPDDPGGGLSSGRKATDGPQPYPRAPTAPGGGRRRARADRGPPAGDAGTARARAGRHSYVEPAPAIAENAARYVECLCIQTKSRIPSPFSRHAKAAYRALTRPQQDAAGGSPPVSPGPTPRSPWSPTTDTRLSRGLAVSPPPQEVVDERHEHRHDEATDSDDLRGGHWFPLLCFTRRATRRAFNSPLDGESRPPAWQHPLGPWRGARQSRPTSPPDASAPPGRSQTGGEFSRAASGAYLSTTRERNISPIGDPPPTKTPRTGEVPGGALIRSGKLPKAYTKQLNARRNHATGVTRVPDRH